MFNCRVEVFRVREGNGLVAVAVDKLSGGGCVEEGGRLKVKFRDRGGGHVEVFHVGSRERARHSRHE